MKKILVVLSGGQDSTTCLFLAKQEAPKAEIHAITFDYGQRHKCEIDAAKKIAALAGCKTHDIVTLPEQILAGTSPLVNKDFDVEQYDNADVLPGGIEKTFVPMRNALFLTIAANRAIVIDADTVVTGVSQEDYGGYPDCRASFIDLMEHTIYKATDQHVHIRTPLIMMTKRETVRLATSLPGCMEALAHSHTCYNGQNPPCGHCHACLLREKGFRAAGVVDPITEGAIHG